MQRKFSVILIVFVLISVLQIQGAAKAKLTIKKPKDSERITKREIAIEGKSEGIDPGTVITIYVRTNEVYEQGTAKIQRNGTWRFYPAIIGAENDKEFYAEIFAETESGIRSNVVTVYRVR